MRCKGLFDSHKLVYVPVIDEKPVDMMKDIKTYATVHGVKIKTELGIFVKNKENEIEQVIRCEVIGDMKPAFIHKTESNYRRLTDEEKKERQLLLEERNERRNARLKRNEDILKDYKNGVKFSEMRKKYNLTDQGIRRILKKEM